jgi:hypothetical protein
MPSSRLQPALLGGLVLGVLSALPLVNLGNLCCCLWVLAGGGVAAWLLQRGQASPITLGDGAAVGFLAGLFGAIVWQALSLPVALITGPIQDRLVARLLDAGDLPESTRRVFEAMRERSGFTAARFVLGGFVVLTISVVFSTLGGLIGAAMVRRNDAPAPGPEPPRPPWTGGA